VDRENLNRIRHASAEPVIHGCLSVGTGNPCKSRTPHCLHQLPKTENKHNSKLTHILATPFLGSKLSLWLSSKDKQCIIFASTEGLAPGILNFEAIGK
jgi:hypothetical protein